MATNDSFSESLKQFNGEFVPGARTQQMSLKALRAVERLRKMSKGLSPTDPKFKEIQAEINDVLQGRKKD